MQRGAHRGELELQVGGGAALRQQQLGDLHRRERGADRALDHVVEAAVGVRHPTLALRLLLQQQLLEVTLRERLLVARRARLGLRHARVDRAHVECLLAE